MLFDENNLMAQKVFLAEFKGFLEKEWRGISYAFLGVGLALFGMLISAALIWPQRSLDMFSGVSLITSMLLIVYIVYTLTEKK